MSLKSAFGPVVDANTRLLILGSLPGDASLKAGQYYGHPQNGFWRLIGGVIGVDLAALPYPERLEALKAAGVGLWDVIAERTRPGVWTPPSATSRRRPEPTGRNPAEAAGRRLQRWHRQRGSGGAA